MNENMNYTIVFCTLIICICIVRSIRAWKCPKEDEYIDRFGDSEEEEIK